MSLLLEAKTVETSENCACYFPVSQGRYEVKPGLRPLGWDFGNGEADKQVFQIDSNFAHYLQMKQKARSEKLSKYYQTCNYAPSVASAIAQLIITRLIQEHPQHFHLQQLATNTLIFHSQLTQETFYLDAEFELILGVGNLKSSYASTLDALAVQIQEDLTVVSRGSDGNNWLSAVHLCFPNHWSASEKIGKDFATVHEPVPGMEKINRRSGAMVNTMIMREPMVRFAWGLSTDTRLNHHLEAPPNIPIREWDGRHFDFYNPRLYLRIERQVIWGLPEYDATLFTIRTYFRDCREMKKDMILRSQLVAALESMTAESLVYKGLVESKDSILAWLNQV
jgi:dimethylamine monooxygenase subunit A